MDGDIGLDARSRSIGARATASSSTVVANVRGTLIAASPFSRSFAKSTYCASPTRRPRLVNVIGDRLARRRIQAPVYQTFAKQSPKRSGEELRFRAMYLLSR